MKFRTYTGARPGIGSVMQALAAPGGGAYGNTMRDLAYVDSAQSAAAKNYASADLDKQQYAAREGIPAALADVPLPEGYTPDLMGRLFTGSENPSMEGFTGAMKDLGATPLQREAADAMRAGDVGRGNAIVSVLSGDAYMPFRQSESGVIDQGTGQHSWSPGHGALAAQRQAGAEENRADARAADALAAQRGVLDVAPGHSLYPTPQPGATVAGALEPLTTAPMTPSQRGAGSGGDPNALNSQLDEFFLEPALNSRGEPLVDPLSGRQAMNPNMDRRNAFAQFWNGVRGTGRFKNINDALVDYVARESAMIDEARAAVQAGAPRDQVIARLREMGFAPPGGL